MLEEVRITRLGVIDDAVLEFSGGFNVVTGETGAGKTMVVTGLGLLFGGRADPSRVRPGADRAAVEGRLRVDPDGPVARQVEEAGGDLDDQGSTLLLGRSVSAEGRSRATAGGRSVPVSLLTYLSEDLVAVHGQSDQQQLLRASRQREALDRFAGPKFAGLLGSYQRAYREHQQVQAELTGLTTQARERAREADELRRGLDEVERVSPADGEDTELREEDDRLANADALHSAATSAHEALLGDPSSGSYEAADAVTLLGTARQALEAAAQHDPKLAALGTRVSEAAYLVSDVAAELASYAQSVEADPARLAAVQDRRAELARLIRAYGPGALVAGEVVAPAGAEPAASAASAAGADGPHDGAPAGPDAAPAAADGRAAGGQPAGGQPAGSEPGDQPGSEPGAGQPGMTRPASELAAVLAWARAAAARLGELDNDDDKIAELGARAAGLAETVAGLAAQLSQARTRTAERFSAEVTAELAALAMPHAALSVAVTPAADFGPHGADEVEIRLAAHPGSPALPLAKGASGGELSRVMLAIEVVFAGADPVPTFVFDEVDAGVGGKAAVEIGRRLARLARLAQVIVVTHLPQVAAFADTHLVVEKSDTGAVVSSGIARLDDEGRVRELSRMLAGLEDSEFGRAHAGELLAAAAAEREAAAPRS
ncbi:MAG TPA: DNA repair protein RecN [Streptosporangiaceae bacterium]|jgi:DNA repair protein RecN (Recombination protein N)